MEAPALPPVETIRLACFGFCELKDRKVGIQYYVCPADWRQGDPIDTVEAKRFTFKEDKQTRAGVGTVVVYTKENEETIRGAGRHGGRIDPKQAAEWQAASQARRSAYDGRKDEQKNRAQADDLQKQLAPIVAAYERCRTRKERAHMLAIVIELITKGV